MIFDNVKSIVIPEGSVKEITCNNVTLWQKIRTIIETVSGVGTIILQKIIRLVSITQYGKCEQASTPTPSAPVDIKCNNGAIKVSANLLNPTTVPNENRYIYANNGDIAMPSTGTFRHSNYIRIVGGETYHFGITPYAATAAGLAWYSTPNLGAYISGVNGTNLKNAGMVTTAPANANYVRFSFRVDAGYDTDWQNSIYICVNGSMSAFHAFGEVYADGTPEVLTICGKNIYNKNYTASEINAFINSTNNTLTQGTIQYAYVLPCKPNTTYTASGMGERTSRWGSFTSKALGTVATVCASGNGTITTGANDKYLIGLISAQSQSGDIDFHDTLQIEVGSTATDYEAYSEQTASATDLFAVGDYKDEQDIISGDVTRACGIKILYGTEEWTTDTYGGYRRMVLQEVLNASGDTLSVICSHYISRSADARQQPNSIFIASTGKMVIYIDSTQNITTVDEFNAWLAAQYANGTPVVIVYPLAESIEESVTPQSFTVNETATISAESDYVDNIALSGTYETLEV